MLSDQDIEQLIDQEIVIYPYETKDLTPVGYNLNPSNFVFSITNKSLIKITTNLDGQKVFKIPANNTVLILTKEAVWVSKKIGGTFHSKVGVVSLGFGHISTTLDPGWAGPLLISLNNPTSKELELPAEKSFVTLIFYKVRKPAVRDHDNDPSRKDLLKPIIKEMLYKLIRNKPNPFNLRNQKANELEENQKQFIKKAEEIIDSPFAYNEFENKYNELSKSPEFSIRKGRGLKINATQEFSDAIVSWSLVVVELIILLLLLLKLISNFVDFVYPLNIITTLIDINGFVAIFALLVSCLQLSVSLNQK